MAQSGYTPILLYGSGTTGNTPSAGNLTTSAAGVELALNYADGKLFYKDNAGVVQVLAVKMPSGVLPAANGGTGQSSYATGDLLYATGATALSKLTLGASTTILTSTGTAPQWSTASSITVGTATNAVNTGITANSANATNYLTFVSNTTGNLPQLVNSGISCNPSTGSITGGISAGTF
jgi:hypothetical protein